MNQLDLFRVSFQTIIAQKMRTILSMLGIIIGVITIILVVSIGTWAQKQVQDQFQNLSVNTIMIFPTRWFTLTTDDVTMIAESPYIASAAGFYQGSSAVSNGDTSSTLAVLWITSDIFSIVSLKAEVGQLFTSDEDKNKDVILWYGAFTQLFPSAKPADVLNTIVTINKKDYTIVSVLTKAWGGFGPLSFDDSVYVPLTTFEKYIAPGSRNSAQLRITAIAKDTDSVANAVEDATTKINDEYEIDSSDSKFRVIDAWSTVSTAQQSAQTLNYLLIGIAAIVFLVSGIGIMNVMFASVAERTKEIGILKSIGADQSSILRQFLLESLILTAVGSIIGVIIGELIIYINPFGSTLTLLRSTWWDILAVSFAMITWLFFGRYPAWKASQLDPVDALRT